MRSPSPRRRTRHVSEKAIPDAARPALQAKAKLDDLADVGEVGGGKIANNIMHFARVLRAAGLPVGPGKVIEGFMAANDWDWETACDWASFNTFCAYNGEGTPAFLEGSLDDEY